MSDKITELPVYAKDSLQKHDQGVKGLNYRIGKLRLSHTVAATEAKTKFAKRKLKHERAVDAILSEFGLLSKYKQTKADISKE